MTATAILRFGFTLVLPLTLASLFLIGKVAASGADNPVQPPGRPAGLEVTAQSGTLEANVAWDDVPGAASYSVRWRLAGPGNPLNEGVTVQSASAAIAVAGHGEWVVRVQACNSAGCGAPTAKRFETVQGTEPTPETTPEPTQTPAPAVAVPAKPAGLQAAAQAGSLEVSVTWDDVPEATSYSVRWRLAGPGNELNDGVTAESSSKVIAVASHGEWVVRVEACNSAGCGTPAAQRVVVEQPAAPSVCDRTSQVRDKLAELTGKACGAIIASDLAGITELDLMNTDITSIQTGDFNDLSGLKKLNLSHNDLTALPEDVFEGLSNLEYLDFFDNMFASLPEDVFEGLSNLEYLDLNCGRMTTLPEDVFDGLSNLETLILSEGDLTELPEDVFDGLSDLHYLDMGINSLTTLPAGVFDGLSSLSYLDIASNELTALPEGVFDDLTNLWKLRLSYNDLAVLPAGVFDNLSTLQFLELKNNELTELSKELFEVMPKMWSLGLSGNPGYPFDLGLSDFVWID